jgi:CheY-like chemotaxis protein
MSLAQSPDENHPRQPRRTILLVEDDVILAATMQMLLESLGYGVEHADTARQALDILERAAVDLVLTDVRIPGTMDGLSLSKHIREQHPRLPIVLTTGSRSNLESVNEFMVLIKPYSLEECAEALNRALSGNH